MRKTRLKLATFGALVLAGVVAATLVGIGSAATQAAPVNTAPPTISGTARVGETLTANNGTWTGDAPITYTYQWQRCDKDGGSCAAIGGANGKTYELKNPDKDNTIRVRVTATNRDGATQRTTTPTGIVQDKAAAPPPPAANGCPAGSGPIAVAAVGPPARLVVDGQSVAPSPVGASTRSLTVRFHVSACGGRAVTGALVYATAVPFNQFSIPPETATGGDGWATMTMNRQSGYPATPSQQLLVVFVRARKSGDPLLGGISTRRLVSFPVNLSR
ncbi:MAG: hypothetical protein H0T13_04805 [Actinobacteria bacterium]|nr:hypothetical protein [Actinomycetota bacterium]